MIINRKYAYQLQNHRMNEEFKTTNESWWILQMLQDLKEEMVWLSLSRHSKSVGSQYI